MVVSFYMSPIEALYPGVIEIEGNMQEKSVACPLCGAFTQFVLTETLRRGTGVVFFCDNCDLGFLVGDHIDAKEYYARDYRQHVSHKAAAAATNPEEIFFTYKDYQDSRIELIRPHLRPWSYVLEIGASAGQFLSRPDVFAARRCAVELDPACCDFMEHALGIEVACDLLPETRFYDQKFDIVCAYQVMEHTEHPVEFLEEIRHVMKPGAVAFVEVPNLNDALLSVWDIGEHIPFYYHQEHRFYFSEKSLKSVAEKAGFKNARVVFTQDYNILNHLNWITNRAPQKDCHIGLAPVRLKGKNEDIANWLSTQLAVLNHQYIDKLVAAGATANATLILTAN